jgi:hypothetical protein
MQRSIRCEAAMFSLIALYFDYRRQTTPITSPVATLARVRPMNDRNAAPVARAA